MQKQEKKFFEGHRSTFWIKMPFGIGHPPPTYQLQSTCMGEGSRVPNLQKEFNYLDSFKSYGIFSDFVVPTWSPHCPCRPHRLHVIPVVSTSSPNHPHHPRHPRRPQKVPMWSPWSVVSTCCLCRPYIVPTSSPSSPHHLEGPHIIPNPPDTHSTHPPPPWGGGGLKSVKMQ